jgi:hypothetical protein
MSIVTTNLVITIITTPCNKYRGNVNSTVINLLYILVITLNSTHTKYAKYLQYTSNSLATGVT